jgi:hypothetical protein
VLARDAGSRRGKTDKWVPLISEGKGEEGDDRWGRAVSGCERWLGNDSGGGFAGPIVTPSAFSYFSISFPFSYLFSDFISIFCKNVSNHFKQTYKIF